MIYPPIRTTARSVQGFTLIEVLVALSIFSIGMLGMLGLLTNSLTLTNSSNHRSKASQAAYAIADHLRVNLSQLLQYNDPASTIVADCSTTTGCVPADLITTEVGLWRGRLATELPGGDGMVCRDSSPTDGTPADWACDDAVVTAPFVVKVCWNDTTLIGGQQCFRSVL